MLTIHAELEALVKQWSREEIPYALCGALALAVFGHPRATYDIDVLAFGGSEHAIRKVARGQGFVLEALPMTFAGGAVKILRISKVDPASEDILSLDILSLSDEMESAVQRSVARWNGLDIYVVSRESLILLKKLRGSGQDQADIEKLL